MRLKLLYRGYWLYLEIGCDELTVSAPHGWAGPERIGVRNRLHPFKGGDVLTFSCRMPEGGFRPQPQSAKRRGTRADEKAAGAG